MDNTTQKAVGVLSELGHKYSWYLKPAMGVGRDFDVEIYFKKHWWSKRVLVEDTAFWGKASSETWLQWLEVLIGELVDG